jgi:hypothetical protein
VDRRDQNHQWWSSFDESRMLLIIESGEDGADLEIPAVYAVCSTCEGKGSHVNPSIDAHGISADEFDEDPDFAESYWRGDYDVPCAECGGRRVSPEPDWDRMTPELKAKVEVWIEDFYAYQRECDMERRMGC